jgi:23S rRNA (uracil1939-C5)-methyltransferase
MRRQKLPAEPVELEITGINHEGRGIARREGKVAFVAGALSGETVTAQWVRKHSAFDEFKAITIHESSDQRVEPKCKFTDQCGGCSLQHWASNEQILFKQSVLLELLTKATGIAQTKFELLQPLLADTEAYRRKARLGVRLVPKKGGVLVGFREKYSSFITEMDNCSVLIQEVACLIDPLRLMIATLDCNRVLPQIEVAAGDKSSSDLDHNHVALVFRHLEALSEADSAALAEFGEVHGVDIYLQSGGLETVFKLTPNDGIERLHYFLPEFDLQLNFHPMDFTQINAKINRLIVSQALQKLQLNSADVVLDLFCGLGNFTLAMARGCGQVVGVEGSTEMVARGYENSSLNGIENAEFYAANLMQPITQHPWYAKKYTKILLDPPRSGAGEIIAEVAALKAQRIVYVSCNPATLARDTALLLDHGYRLEAAGVMDMFPHTTHVESMAVFELCK